MKSISNRTFERIYDNVKRCNYLAKLGFDERIFSRVFYFQPSNPTLKSKISDIYIFQIYLYIYIGSVGIKGILKILKKFLIAGFFENTIGD